MISLNDSFINFAIFLKEARKSEMTTEIYTNILAIEAVNLRSIEF